MSDSSSSKKPAPDRLQIIDPEGQISTQLFTGEALTIGRAAENDLAFQSFSLSRHHADIECGDDGVIRVTDRGSKNGVYVNNKRLIPQTPAPVGNGDEIDICGYRIHLLYPGNEELRQMFEGQNTPLAQSVTIEVMGASEIRSQLRTAGGGDSATSITSEDIPASEILSAAVDLLGTRELVDVRDRVLDFVARVVHFDAAYLVHQGEAVDEFQIDASRAPNQSPDRPPISKSILKDAIRDRKPVLLVDAASDDRYDATQSIVGLGIRSAIAVPLVADDDTVLGVVYVMRFGDSRRFTENDGRALATVAAIAALRFQNARLEDEALLSRFYEGEMSVAAKIQMDLLPAKVPSIPNYEVHGSYTPCHTTSGDFYDFVEQPDGRLALALGDVSGKGVGAAMLMFSVVTVLRTLFGDLDKEGSFEGLLGRANLTLAGTMSEGRFATALAGCLNPTTGELVYSNAGQCGVFIRQDGTHELVEYHGTPLGMFDFATYDLTHATINQGDIFFLYSDGVSEARAESGEFYGDARVIEQLVKHRHLATKAIGAEIEASLASFVGDAPRADDTTFLIIKRAIV